MVDREGESDREILVDRRSERDGKSNKIVKLERAVSIKLLCNYQSTKQGGGRREKPQLSTAELPGPT